MDYKEKQKEFRKRSRLGTFYKELGTYSINKDGLLNFERDVLKTLFINEKTAKRFDKLSGMQKKVIRKMGWDKTAFLKKYDLKTNK